MRKLILISYLITFFAITPVQAENNDKRYEMILEDIIYSFLSPLESKAIKDYLGESYLSDFCKFVEVKTKPDQAYRYEITYQFIIYERALEPPYHLFTLKVDNKSATDWFIKDVKVRKLAENEDIQRCVENQGLFGNQSDLGRFFKKGVASVTL